MPGFIRAGSDRAITGLFVFVGGIAKTVSNAWIYEGGVARQFYTATTLDLSISVGYTAPQVVSAGVTWKVPVYWTPGADVQSFALWVAVNGGSYAFDSYHDVAESEPLDVFFAWSEDNVSIKLVAYSGPSGSGTEGDTATATGIMRP